MEHWAGFRSYRGVVENGDVMMAPAAVRSTIQVELSRAGQGTAAAPGSGPSTQPTIQACQPGGSKAASLSDTGQLSITRATKSFVSRGLKTRSTTVQRRRFSGTRRSNDAGPTGSRILSPTEGR